MSHACAWNARSSPIFLQVIVLLEVLSLCLESGLSASNIYPASHKITRSASLSSANTVDKRKPSKTVTAVGFAANGGHKKCRF